MDLNDLKPLKEPQALALRDPITGEELINEDGSKWTLLLVGADSDEYRAVIRKWNDEKVKKAFREKGGKDELFMDYDEQRNFRLDLAISCVKGWTGLTLGGQPYEYTKENCSNLLREWLWIANQAYTFIEDATNFFKRR